MNTHIRALMARRDTALAAARQITDGLHADANLTAEQQAEVDGHLAQVRSFNRQIEDAQAAEDSVLSPQHRGRETPRVDASYGTDPGNMGGFDSAADFLTAVMKAGNPSLKSVDDRLFIGAAPTTFGQEGVGEDGGYTVPGQLANTIFDHSLAAENLLSFCASTPVSGNSMSFPVSESTPWGSSGVEVAWEGEAQQFSQSKPAFESRELRLRKLTALVPITNELLEDSVALAAWLPRELGKAARWKVNDAIVNGAGSGVPQGFTGSGALITQAAEGSQAADTIVAENITKMFGRCLNPSTAVWLVNPDAINQLPLMVIGDQPVWVPPSGLAAGPGGMLMGRPVIMTDACQTLGDAGDIYFADLQSYAVIQKQGPRIDTSMHLWFDYDMMAFRLRFRIDGQSLVRNAVTPPNSSVTRSPFVRLEART